MLNSRHYNNKLTKILLDCDQSNVLLARIIFFCILLRAFFVPFGLY